MIETGFEALKKRYTEQIARKEAELESLRGKLALLQEVEAEQTQLQLNVGATKFSGKGLTEALMDGLADYNGTGVTAGDLRRYIVKHGYHHGGKNLDVALYTTLKRLSERGRVQTELTNGKRYYRKK